MNKSGLKKSMSIATYAKKSFAMMKMIKGNLTYIIKPEIIVIVPENLKELLIALAI